MAAIDGIPLNMDFSGLLNNVFLGIFIVVLVAVLGAGGYYFLYVSSFKHKFRIREVINGRVIVRDTRAREYKDKDGVSYWQLIKGKKLIPLPPSEAIEIDWRGKKCVDAKITETGEVIYLTDKGAKISALEPLTTNQRIILIEQIKKAHEKKSKSWKDMLGQIVYVSALLILVVSLLIFYEDMGKPLLAAQDKQIALQTIYTEQLQILKEIKTDTQLIRGEVSDVPLIEAPPN